MLRGQKERCQTLRGSACTVDSSGISSGSGSGGSDGSQSVHRHIKVLMTGLGERNAHSLDNKATFSHNSHLTQTFTGHAGDSAAGWRYHFKLYIPKGIVKIFLGGNRLVHFLAESGTRR